MLNVNKYEKPTIEAEEFTPNEYIACCKGDKGGKGHRGSSGDCGDYNCGEIQTYDGIDYIDIDGTAVTCDDAVLACDDQAYYCSGRYPSCTPVPTENHS